jgi:peptide deformylase
MPKLLVPTRFGNPILRDRATELSVDEIQSDDIQSLIADMAYTLLKEDYGVGIAAPQVGRSVALSVIGIKPTPNRPNLEPFSTTIINPKITETYGEPEPKWEACISCGAGDNILYAQVARFNKVKLTWLDETAKSREEIVDGFVAHVVQHEVDHLNGILFLDRVEDPTTYMMADEYQKRIVKPA